MSISYGGTGNIAHEVTFSFQKAQSNLVDDPNNGGNNGGLKRITLKKTITHNDQAATSAQAAMIVSGQADALVDILSVNAQFSECIDIPHLPRFRGRDPPRRIGVWGEHGFSATCDSQQCLETFASVTAGKLINLPPTCGSHFTKVVSISRNQASPNRFEITYNFEFGTGVVATQPVTFEAHYGNVPNLLTIIGAENDNTAVAKRGLERRNLFSSFNEWLQKVSSVTVESSQTFEMRQSFDEILFDAKGQCIRDGHRLTSEIQVAISGSAFARGTFGVYVAGHLAPTPKIDTAYVYFKAESGARVELDMFANVNYEKQDVARLATLHLTPFQIPGVGSIGPLLELDIGYDARFSMHGAFKAAVDVNIPPLFVAYGDQEASTASTSDAVTGNADHASGSGVDNIIQPSLRVDFQAGGSVQVFVIPKATLDIDLLEGALDAQVGLSAQAGLTGTLTAEASAGTGQDARASACLGLDANFGVNLLAQGTAFWTKSATQQMSLYTMSPLQLFKKCFGTGTEDANQGNNSTTTPGTGGPVLQLPGGNDGSTAVARRTSDMNVRGGMKRRLISRVNRLKKRSTPLFSLNVDLCPAEGSQGQDPPPPSCPLPPRTRRDGGAQPHNGTSLVHLQRRVVTVQPGTLFKDQAFFRRVLTPPTDRPEDRGWPFLKSKDVFFQGENVGKTLHHIIPWQRINEVFRKVIFVEGPPSPEGKTWQMQCPSLLGNLIQLVENPDPDRKFNAFSDEAEKKFKLFLQAMNADAPSIEAHMRASTDPALQLNADTDVFKIGEDFDMMGAWFPFNIFVGPVSSKRLDDPGEEFETGARCVFEYVCDDRLGGKMWTLLEQLNSYLKPGATTDAATLDKFCQLLTTLVDPNTGQGFTPWPYAEDRWERPTGTVSKGKKGSQKILQLKKCDDVSRTNVPL
ncbi:hypothetical protein HK102_007524 [Quaeritorhiza haematococci]|nr:hypothetical protein HK102_007524 [Quaeritorhiza haematococci]